MPLIADKDLSSTILELDAAEVKAELISKYPTKVARKRAKQIVVNEVGPDSCVPEIASNVRTIPGIISQRGCTYAGCKGRSVGPHPGYRQHHPRPHRLRLLFLADPPESDPAPGPGRP